MLLTFILNSSGIIKVSKSPKKVSIIKNSSAALHNRADQYSIIGYYAKNVNSETTMPR